MTTPNPLTPSDLDHLRKLNAERTPGDWIVKGDEVGYISKHDDQTFGMFCPLPEYHAPNAAFIAACSTYVPRLLADRDALEARVRGLEAKLEAAKWWLGTAQIHSDEKMREVVAQAYGQLFGQRAALAGDGKGESK